MRLGIVVTFFALVSCSGEVAENGEISPVSLSAIEESKEGRSLCAQGDVSFLNAHQFGDLAPLVGRCYLGTPVGGSASQAKDIQFWSIALGGAAITIEHALEDGSYGGISYIYPSAKPDAFTYVYITNAGFHTQGTIIVNDDQSFTASETVNGHPTITEVRSISRFDETGLTSMTSEFLDQGEWQPGPAFTHEVTTEPFPRLLMPIPASLPTPDE